MEQRRLVRMVLVELTEYVGKGGTLAILVFIASLPIAYLYSWAAFRGQREWLAISLVASTAFHLIGFALVWLVYVAMRKAKVVRIGDEKSRDDAE